MTTITAAGTGDVTTPLLVTGYQTTRESRNIRHQLIDGGTAFGLLDPDPRSGDLQYLYSTEAEAAACVEMHTVKTTFTLVDDDLSTIGMTYVVGNGGVRSELESQTRKLWLVTISYWEIIP